MDKGIKTRSFKDSKAPNNIKYICKALSGTKLDEPFWQIKCFISYDEGDSILWAEGIKGFKLKASERENYNYS